MKKNAIKKVSLMLMCAAALAGAAPAMPVHARPRTQSSRSARSQASDTERMRDTAHKVLLAFDQQDLTKLSKLCEYPVTVLYADGHLAEFKNKEEFQAIGKSVIFSETMRNAIGSTNTAKLEAVGKAGANMGNDYGLTIRKRNGKWRVNHFYIDSAYQARSAGTENVAQAAEDIQKTFYYRDLETLSKQCSYPLDLFLADGSYQSVQTAQQLMNLGEDKVFTQDLIDAVMQSDASNLAQLGTKGRKLGGDKGADLHQTSDGWKVWAIYQ